MYSASRTNQRSNPVGAEQQLALKPDPENELVTLLAQKNIKNQTIAMDQHPNYWTPDPLEGCNIRYASMTRPLIANPQIPKFALTPQEMTGIESSNVKFYPPPTFENANVIIPPSVPRPPLIPPPTTARSEIGEFTASRSGGHHFDNYLDAEESFSGGGHQSIQRCPNAVITMQSRTVIYGNQLPLMNIYIAPSNIVSRGCPIQPMNMGMPFIRIGHNLPF